MLKRIAHVRQRGEALAGHIPSRSMPQIYEEGRLTSIWSLATRPATGVLQARSVPRLSRECPRKRGVSEGVSGKMSLGPLLQSVQEVSRECPGHLFDTRGEKSRRTLPRTPPVFGDTLWDTPGTLRARETPVAGRGVRKNRITTQMELFEPQQTYLNWRRNNIL